MAKIPNYFHFVFGLKKQHEPFHLMYYLCLNSCLKVNKPEKIFFYYVNEPFGIYWELIKPNLELVKVAPNDFVKSYKYPKIGRKRNSYAHHADFIRLEKLVEKGGVYADIDTLFVKKLPAHLFQKSFVLGQEPEILSETTGQTETSLCNAFIMAEKDSSFAKRWLEKMQSHFDGSWSNHSTLLPRKLSEQYPEEIHIEPLRSFYRFTWTPDDLQDLFENAVDDLEDVYSIHLWKHLWFSRWNRGFCRFHGRLLTEDYVMSAKTTYARLAKPYLPTSYEKAIVKRIPVSTSVVKRMKKGVSDAGYLFTRVAAKIEYMIKE